MRPGFFFLWKEQQGDFLSRLCAGLWSKRFTLQLLLWGPFLWPVSSLRGSSLTCRLEGWSSWPTFIFWHLLTSPRLLERLSVCPEWKTNRLLYLHEALGYQRASSQRWPSHLFRTLTDAGPTRVRLPFSVLFFPWGFWVKTKPKQANIKTKANKKDHKF